MPDLPPAFLFLWQEVPALTVIWKKIGEVIGAEVRAVGGNYYGGVCINLPRNPRWGRAQECYGEDTYHLGEMGGSSDEEVFRARMLWRALNISQ